jgi:hypothetical protein
MVMIAPVSIGLTLIKQKEITKKRGREPNRYDIKMQPTKSTQTDQKISKRREKSCIMVGVKVSRKL